MHTCRIKQIELKKHSKKQILDLGYFASKYFHNAGGRIESTRELRFIEDWTLPNNMETCGA